LVRLSLSALSWALDSADRGYRSTVTTRTGYQQPRDGDGK